MTITTLTLDGPHWAFALRFYNRPSVADACLMLQDCAGVDVNVLLMALHAACDRGVALSISDVRDMDEAVLAWRTEVVQALRAVRRRMKAGPEPAPSEATEALRDQIKAAELGAEQIQQAVLACWLDRHYGEPSPQVVAVGDVVQNVVAYFAARRGTIRDMATKSDAQVAMQTLVQAAATLNSTPNGTST